MPETFGVIEKDKTTIFTSAKEAGAAFFEAKIEKRPSVFHEMEKDTKHPHGAARILATTEIWGEYENGSIRYEKNLSHLSNNQVDKEFNAGYTEALGKSVNERLKSTDWEAIKKESPELALNLDQRLSDDLKKLSLRDFEKASKAWEDYAPKGIKVPTFLEISPIEAEELAIPSDKLQAARVAEAAQPGLGFKTEGQRIGIENSITDVSERVIMAKGVQQGTINTQKQVDEAEKPKLPRGVEERYINIDGKFFNRNNTNMPAFIDKGKSLTTNTHERQVINDMVAVAKSKNWGVLNLKGTKEFRRIAWLEAESQGLKTVGYKPTEAEIEGLKKLAEERSTNQISGNDRQIKQPEKEIKQQQELTALKKDQHAKVLAAEKVFSFAIKELPEDKQKKLINELQAKLLNPANIDRLPKPQHKTQERISNERQSNRER